MTRSAPRLDGPFWMVAVPLGIVAVFSALLALPATREAAQWSLGEHRPVELLSFALFVVGGVWALRVAAAERRRGSPALVVAFYALFGVGLLVVGGEEVAWGQWFVRFETPEAIAAVNTQGELTLHNHEVFNDHLEAFPMAFGLAGLLGIWLGRFRAWAPVAAPRALWVWFAVVAGVSAVDLLQDWYVLHPDFDHLVNWLDEAIEMMVAAAGLLYVALNAARLRQVEGAPAPPVVAQTPPARAPAVPEMRVGAV